MGEFIVKFYLIAEMKGTDALLKKLMGKINKRINFLIKNKPSFNIFVAWNSLETLKMKQVF